VEGESLDEQEERLREFCRVRKGRREDLLKIQTDRH